MTTLTKADIADRLSQMLSVSRPSAKKFVNEFFDTMVDTLSKCEDLKISGFGSFIIHAKNARPGRNPKSGEPKTIDARKVVIFKPGSKLKDKLKLSKVDVKTVENV